jgi:hypothetical protein
MTGVGLKDDRQQSGMLPPLTSARRAVAVRWRCSSISKPINWRPSCFAAASVEPEPANGSWLAYGTGPSRSGVWASRPRSLLPCRSVLTRRYETNLYCIKTDTRGCPSLSVSWSLPAAEDQKILVDRCTKRLFDPKSMCQTRKRAKQGDLSIYHTTVVSYR